MNDLIDNHEQLERGVERPFRLDELFFSTTDQRGEIRSGNDVFIRVSGYHTDELIGRPHNVIRHADTPRSVFRLLWHHLEHGQPIAAYVKNRAKDGSHYWVLAAARPIGATMLSVRLKPTSPLFEAIKAVYAEMRTVEHNIERAAGSRREAMDASTELLHQRLTQLGFTDYDTFMRAAVATEVTNRRNLLAGDRATRRHRHGINATLTTELDAQLVALEHYLALNRQLTQRSAALVDLAEDGKILALNAVLASRRLGTDGGPLVAIAEAMQDAFPRVIEHAKRVVTQINATRTALDHIAFAAGLAVLQDEIATTYHHELNTTRNASGSLGDMDLLRRCLDDDLGVLVDTLATVQDGLAATSRSAVALEADLIHLGVIERNGRIEAARASKANAFGSLLDQIRDRVTTALTETRQLGRLATQARIDGITTLAAARHTDSVAN